MQSRPDIELRWYEEGFPDTERLVDLLKQFGDFLPAPLSGRMDLRAYAAKLASRASIAVVVVDGTVAGMQGVYANDRESLEAHLPFISVLPEHRRKGVAAVMISRALALARARGMKRLTLEVRETNAPALALYRRFGFGVRSKADGSLLMEVDLAGFVPIEPEAATAIETAPRLAAVFGLDVDLRIKRDDLYPMAGGGIKARKIGHILRRALHDGHDALVTNGGPQSNHCRATAIAAARLGIRCHLVLVLEPGRRYRRTGNLLLMQLSGATIEWCAKDELAARMDSAIERLAREGHRPLYIWGGGHSVEGTAAFVDAAHEARQQCGTWVPDYVVAASATGSTQAGFAIGYADTPSRVIGISAARPAERGTAIVQECVQRYSEATSTPCDSVEVQFRDDWTDGGYEQYSPALFDVIETAARAGVFVCPTYSGKALRGLVDLVRTGEIPARSRVLFWHTGGLMNLQAVSAYADEEVAS